MSEVSNRAGLDLLEKVFLHGIVREIRESSFTSADEPAMATMDATYAGYLERPSFNFMEFYTQDVMLKICNAENCGNMGGSVRREILNSIVHAASLIVGAP